MTEKHSFRVNGKPVDVAAPPMQRLLDVLREQLGLTGTKYGCGEGECGACTVMVDGHAVMSCLVPVVQVAGCSIETVEGLAAGASPLAGAAAAGALSPLQERFLECGGAQCGICTPGILMAIEGYRRAGGVWEREAIREAIAGNICRCTGYTRIIDAVMSYGGGGACPE